MVAKEITECTQISDPIQGPYGSEFLKFDCVNKSGDHEQLITNSDGEVFVTFAKDGIHCDRTQNGRVVPMEACQFTSDLGTISKPEMEKAGKRREEAIEKGLKLQEDIRRNPAQYKKEETFEFLGTNDRIRVEKYYSRETKKLVYELRNYTKATYYCEDGSHVEFDCDDEKQKRKPIEREYFQEKECKPTIEDGLNLGKDILWNPGKYQKKESRDPYSGRLLEKYYSKKTGKLLLELRDYSKVTYYCDGDSIQFDDLDERRKRGL